MTSDEILTIIMVYIEEYGDHIIVREEIDGVWGYYSLNELPGRKAIAQAFRLIRSGVRVLSDEEVRARQQGEGAQP